jgi:hypothetical protein
VLLPLPVLVPLSEQKPVLERESVQLRQLELLPVVV